MGLLWVVNIIQNSEIFPWLGYHEIVFFVSGIEIRVISTLVVGFFLHSCELFLRLVDTTDHTFNWSTARPHQYWKQPKIWIGCQKLPFEKHSKLVIKVWVSQEWGSLTLLHLCQLWRTFTKQESSNYQTKQSCFGTRCPSSFRSLTDIS